MGPAVAEHDEVARKKKSETRKHTAMIRVDERARVIAAKAASLMGLSLADYCSDVLWKAADRDLKREARKITGGEQ